MPPDPPGPQRSSKRYGAPPALFRGRERSQNTRSDHRRRTSSGVHSTAGGQFDATAFPPHQVPAPPRANMPNPLPLTSQSPNISAPQSQAPSRRRSFKEAILGRRASTPTPGPAPPIDVRQHTYRQQSTSMLVTPSEKTASTSSGSGLGTESSGSGEDSNAKHHAAPGGGRQREASNRTITIERAPKGLTASSLGHHALGHHGNGQHFPLGSDSTLVPAIHIGSGQYVSVLRSAIDGVIFVAIYPFAPYVAPHDPHSIQSWMQDTASFPPPLQPPFPYVPAVPYQSNYPPSIDTDLSCLTNDYVRQHRDFSQRLQNTEVNPGLFGPYTSPPQSHIGVVPGPPLVRIASPMRSDSDHPGPVHQPAHRNLMPEYGVRRIPTADGNVVVANPPSAAQPFHGGPASVQAPIGPIPHQVGIQSRTAADLQPRQHVTAAPEPQRSTLGDPISLRTRSRPSPPARRRRTAQDAPHAASREENNVTQIAGPNVAASSIDLRPMPGSSGVSRAIPVVTSATSQRVPQSARSRFSSFFAAPVEALRRIGQSDGQRSHATTIQESAGRLPTAQPQNEEERRRDTRARSAMQAIPPLAPPARTNRYASLARGGTVLGYRVTEMANRINAAEEAMRSQMAAEAATSPVRAAGRADAGRRNTVHSHSHIRGGAPTSSRNRRSPPPANFIPGSPEPSRLLSAPPELVEMQRIMQEQYDVLASITGRTARANREGNEAPDARPGSSHGPRSPSTMRRLEGFDISRSSSDELLEQIRRIDEIHARNTERDPSIAAHSDDVTAPVTQFERQQALLDDVQRANGDADLATAIASTDPARLGAPFRFQFVSRQQASPERPLTPRSSRVAALSADQAVNSENQENIPPPPGDAVVNPRLSPQSDALYVAARDEDLICAICQEIMAIPVRLQPCQHEVCAECAGTWIRSRLEAHTDPDCPHCREPLQDRGWAHISEARENAIRDFFQQAGGASFRGYQDWLSRQELWGISRQDLPRVLGASLRRNRPTAPSASNEAPDDLDRTLRRMEEILRRSEAGLRLVTSPAADATRSEARLRARLAFWSDLNNIDIDDDEDDPEVLQALAYSFLMQ